MSTASGIPRPAGDGRALAGRPFIDSHLARMACTRQLARVVAEVTRRVAFFHGNDATPVPASREMPDRYIVQVGPVALTIGWLPGRLDTVATGELLAIVWRGIIGPRVTPSIGRTAVRPAPTATAEWEEIASVGAESEERWRWYPAGADPAGYTSEELASRCVDRLKLAYAGSIAA